MRYIYISLHIWIGGDFDNSAVDNDILGITGENIRRSFSIKRIYFDFSADASAGDFGKIFHHHHRRHVVILWKTP